MAFLDKKWKILLYPLLVTGWATERKCHGGICLCCWPLHDTRELLITRPLFCLIQNTKQCFICTAGCFPSGLTQWQNCSKLSRGILGFPVVICFNPHSVLQRLSLALLQWSAEEAFKGRGDSGTEVSCFVFGLESCCWNSKHEISLETFFVCLSEEIAGRRRPVSWALRETYWLWIHWGHYLRSVDLWEGMTYLMQPKVSYATDGLFFVVKSNFSVCLWKSKVLLKACCVLAGSYWVSSSSDFPSVVDYHRGKVSSGKGIQQLQAAEIELLVDVYFGGWWCRTRCTWFCFRPAVTSLSSPPCTSLCHRPDHRIV